MGRLGRLFSQSRKRWQYTITNKISKMSIKFNLPYTVKITQKNNSENMNNFSIVILTKNNEATLPNLLKSLEEFKNNGGDVNILDIGSTDNTTTIASEWGCKVENGSSFLRIIDEDMAQLINDKFKKDNNKIAENGDTYVDYSGARDYLATLASNDMILMLDPRSYFVEFKLMEIKKYLEEDKYNRFKFVVYKKNGVCEFYNRKQYKWNDISREILIISEGQENSFDISDGVLRISISDEIQEKETLVGLAVNNFLFPNSRISKLFAIEMLNIGLLNSAFQEFDNGLKIYLYSNIEKSEILVYMGDCLINNNNDDDTLGIITGLESSGRNISSSLFARPIIFVFPNPNRLSECKALDN